eukprot:1360267-Amorphochlora_amoeboformis.AAC.3
MHRDIPIADLEEALCLVDFKIVDDAGEVFQRGGLVSSNRAPERYLDLRSCHGSVKYHCTLNPMKYVWTLCD